MLSTFMITLREGIEAFLIVAITLDYLRKSQQSHLFSAVYWGTGLAAILSFVAATFFQEANNKPLWEGLLAAAASIAWAWSRYGQRINIARFLQVTALFLVLFVIQLLIYSFHELTEANVLPIDNTYWHLATEPYGPEGTWGELLTYSMVVLPVAWLLWTWLQEQGKRLPS